MTCIGYSRVPDTHASEVYWGLKYAPFNRDVAWDDPLTCRNGDKIFVALGGGATVTSTLKVVESCLLSNENCQITVLLSPVNNINAEDVQINQVGNVEVCKNVPDLSHFFKTAGVIVASYGHLAYEAMSYGAPICLVGQKQFQTEYARQLEQKQLCVSAGVLSELTTEQLAKSIETTRDMANDLSHKTFSTLDGGGFASIAELIYEKYLNLR